MAGGFPKPRRDGRLIAAMTPEVEALFRAGGKRPMLPAGEWSVPTVMDRQAIQRILPHRDPFLLIDRITLLDREYSLIAAAYDLDRAQAVFAGHFPDAPSWPGVLQIEAIGQAGMVLALSTASSEPRRPERDLALTQVLAAQFVRPVRPGSDVEIVARVVEDGLFVVIVGQCLQNGEICSVAAVRGVW